MIQRIQEIPQEFHLKIETINEIVPSNTFL